MNNIYGIFNRSDKPMKEELIRTANVVDDTTKEAVNSKDNNLPVAYSVENPIIVPDVYVEHSSTDEEENRPPLRVNYSSPCALNSGEACFDVGECAILCCEALGSCS
ncbi:MAG: hypothetical protein CMF55_05690 [Legionellales bacterium]|nr:hypothetical protein [Legionellales bacterium]HAG62289.1 hypothetical protein [Coxiellaceae bacterium]